MKIPLEDRKAYFIEVPWIRRMKNKTECHGYTGRGWTKCKKRAEWLYTTRGRSWWTTEPKKHYHYCWAHLIYWGLYGDPAEEERWKRYQEEYPPPWRNDVRRPGSEPEGEGEARAIPEPGGVQPNAGGGTQDGGQ